MSGKQSGKHDKPSSRAAVSNRHSLYGWMKSTVTIAPGVDLTEFAGPQCGLDRESFQESLSHEVPPRGTDPPLAALWWAKKGDWDKAHRLVMDETSREAAWVHAYIHRVEGDLGNAHYWYRQARHQPAEGDLDAEWDAVVTTLLDKG